MEKAGWSRHPGELFKQPKDRIHIMNAKRGLGLLGVLAMLGLGIGWSGISGGCAVAANAPGTAGGAGAPPGAPSGAPAAPVAPGGTADVSQGPQSHRLP